jgi:parallel beta-helix repeat protein
MFRKIVAVWVSLAMLLGVVVIVDVVTDITPPVRAATITVDDSGGADYLTIQEGVDAANPGDTIFVYAGNYTESVHISKIINLTGENKDTTIIKGTLFGDVLHVDTNWVNITDFMITKSESMFGGIRLSNAQNCNIFNNNVTSNLGYGIYLTSSSNNIIKDNIISNNRLGIYLLTSANNNISNNNFINDGVFIRGTQGTHFNSHNIPTTNNVNGKPLYYYKSCTNLDINGISAGQLILAGCTNITVKNIHINNTDVGIELADSTNVTLTGNNVSSNFWTGIHIESATNNSVFRNNVTDNQYGIYVYSSSFNNISNNNVTNNTYGLSLYYSLNNIVTKNYISNIHSGIRLEESANRNSILCNDIIHNEYGMIVSSASNNTISDNNITSNDSHGISMGPSSDNNTMINNNIILNGGYGIALRGSRNIVANNNIISCTWYGIQFHGISTKQNIIINNNISNNWCCIYIEVASNNNRIYHNDFINNLNPPYDDTNKNFWNDTYPSGGNYWSDYSGVDNYNGPNQDIPGSDGIGDTPYTNIQGGAGSQDNYPLMQPYKPLENYTVLKEGWNLISIPLIQDNQDLTKVLEMIDGYYVAVQFYNQTDPSDLWKHQRVGKPFGNDLFELKETMGFWIYINQPGDTIFLYNGTQPSSNQSITLHPGWNMVGYPSLSNRNRTAALNNLNYGSDVDAIWTFNAATQTWQEIGSSDYFELGRGYWIHSKVTKVWDVPL